MRLENFWVGALKSVVATRKFCIEYRTQGRWLDTVQSAGKRHLTTKDTKGHEGKAQLFRLQSRKRAADFPVVAEGIYYASDAPLVFLGHRVNFLGAGLHSAGKDSIGVRHRKDDSDCDAAQGFGAVVVMLGRFVTQPEFGALNRQAGNYAITLSHAK